MSLQTGFAFVPTNALGHYQSEASFNSWSEVFLNNSVVNGNFPYSALVMGGEWAEFISGSPGDMAFEGLSFMEGSLYLGWVLDFIFCF